MSVEKGFTKENLDYYLKELAKLSKQAVLQVQKYEGEKVKESNVEEIIQKALRKKRDDRGAR